MRSLDQNLRKYTVLITSKNLQVSPRDFILSDERTMMCILRLNFSDEEFPPLDRYCLIAKAAMAGDKERRLIKVE